ncbi:hypothetical protein TNIN_219461 [Trichonephila inaurata madagascariensis]|uniref:Uncharacterized protein n=1 Tax=Trichonephila inaurata madagascariensis TaxID=2747483 RepID=A0A8X6WPB6_9ARAC|nr:hypothetical protein TNIN_219461 [Trichonephila inaurata madagascariensis]
MKSKYRVLHSFIEEKIKERASEEAAAKLNSIQAELDDELYSPPSEFHLFGQLKEDLRGLRFALTMGIRNGV